MFWKIFGMIILIFVIGTILNMIVHKILKKISFHQMNKTSDSFKQREIALHVKLIYYIWQVIMDIAIITMVIWIICEFKS
jgi:hypothetical protein